MSISNYLKNFCPLSVMFRIKYIRQFLNQAEIATQTASPKIYYLDAPSYGNIGDQAIAYAIGKFASIHFPDYEFIEVPQDDMPQYTRYLKSNITEQDIIFLTGGGNMGNIYRIYEATRRFVIKNFPNNKVVIFPQTIEYTTNFFGRLSLSVSRKIYGTHKHLTLMAREHFSFEKMKEWYPNNRILLCPDIVLSLGKINTFAQRTKIGVCLRNDCEKTLTDEDRNVISTVLNRLNTPIETITTLTDITSITCQNREGIVLGKLEEISRCSLLVTDRLHAMIFSVLTHTPCIVFRNSNNKIIGVYNWLKKISFVKLVEHVDDFNNIVDDLLGGEKPSAKAVNISFENIIQAIRKG